MNKKLLVILLSFIAIGSIGYYIRHPLSATVRIRDKTYVVEVAVTPSEKEKGLGDRDFLPKHKGMLFPYDHKEQYSFWMKGMRFPIDIIWILDNQIVDISRNVPIGIDGQLQSYQPKVPINKVLEINAGESDAYGFTIGDLVHIDN